MKTLERCTHILIQKWITRIAKNDIKSPKWKYNIFVYWLGIIKDFQTRLNKSSRPFIQFISLHSSETCPLHVIPFPDNYHRFGWRRAERPWSPGIQINTAPVIFGSMEGEPPASDGYIQSRYHYPPQPTAYSLGVLVWVATDTPHHPILRNFALFPLPVK